MFVQSREVSRKRRDINCCGEGIVTVSEPEDFDPPAKKLRFDATDESTLSDLANDVLWSNDDIMHNILGFFLAEAGNRVDVASMKSVMLVSKQWNAVATSRALWTRLRQAVKVDPITNALSIVDVPGIQGPNAPLIGFLKLEESSLSSPTSSTSPSINNNDETVYRAIERSSGRTCRILATSDRTSMEFINHIFEAHFFQGEAGFLKPENKDVHMRKDYPRGIAFFEGQIVRWYEDGDVDWKLPEPVFGLHPSDNRNGEQMKAVRARLPDHVQCVPAFLRTMEMDQAGSHLPMPEYFCTRSWALVVDWLVEIAYCFTLPHRTVFHAMDLFGRYLSLASGRLQRNYYQLTASACMEIASKCNRTKMKPADFTYCSDNLFTLQELAWTEIHVFSTLDGRLARPTIMDFIEAFEAASDSDIGNSKMESLLLRYVAQLALQSQIHRYQPASLTAACVVVLARFCNPENLPLWRGDDYERLLGYAFDKVCEDVVTLSRCLDEIREQVPDVNVIERKFVRYADVQHDGVVPSIASAQMLHAYQRRVTSPNVIPP